MKTQSLILAAVSILLFSFKSFGQIGDVRYDRRIKNQLDNLGLKYSITEKGNFTVVFKSGDNRTQMVIINSMTYEYEGLEIREIYSTAASMQQKSELTQRNMFALLERNEEYKIGA